MRNHNYHHILAKYFKEKSLYLDENIKMPNTRKLVELPWQQIRAGYFDDLTDTLCDLKFIEASCRNDRLFKLIGDFKLAQNALPENKSDILKARKQKNSIKRWIKAMKSYSRFWSKQRKNQTKEVPHTSKIEIPIPPATCHYWSEEEIIVRIERIRLNPNRADILNAYADFVFSECYTLMSLNKIPGFIMQHAWNHASAGPVHNSAKEFVSSSKTPMILRRWYLDSYFDPSPALITSLSGHTKEITGVAISTDGSLAVSSSEDNTMRVWDLNNGRCLSILNEHRNSVEHFALSLDGKCLVSADRNDIRIWDIASGEWLQTIEHDGQITCFAITPDGNCAVSNGDNGSLKIWTRDAKLCTINSIDKDENICAIRVSPDGHYAITASQNGIISLWNITKKCYERTFNNQNEDLFPHLRQYDIVDFIFSPVLKEIIALVSDDTLMVWNIETGQCLRTISAPGIDNFLVTADGKFIVTSGEYNGYLCVRNIEDGSYIKTIEKFGKSISNYSITSDGRRALTGDSDGLLNLWNLENGTTQREHTMVNHIAVTPQGNHIVIGSCYETFLFVDVNNGQCTQILEGQQGSISCFAITADGRFCFSAGDESLGVWDLSAGKCLKILENNGFIQSIGITPDGRVGIIGGDNGRIDVWDLELGEKIDTFFRFQDDPDSKWTTIEQITEDSAKIVITPDGNRVVSTGRYNVPEVWDIKSGQCLHTLRGHKGRMKKVIVTPDGQLAVSAGSDGTIRIWNLETGNNLNTFNCINAQITDIVISPDGRYICSHNWDGIIQIWDIETACTIQVLNGHSGEITCVVFASDGQHLVSAGSDCTLRVWDYIRGQEICIYSSGDVIEEIVFTLEGQVICGITSTEEIIFLDLANIDHGQVMSGHVKTKFKDYEQVLRNGLVHCQTELGKYHKETLAHLEALVLHLEYLGKHEDAKLVSIERDEVKVEAEDNEGEEVFTRLLRQARSGRDDMFDIEEGQELWCLESLITLLNKMDRSDEALCFAKERDDLLDQKNRIRLDTYRRCFESAEVANQICAENFILQKIANFTFTKKLSEKLNAMGYNLLSEDESALQLGIERNTKHCTDFWGGQNNLLPSIYLGPDAECDPIIKKLTDIVITCLSTNYNKILVEKILGYLSLSRHGLKEQNLLVLVMSAPNIIIEKQTLLLSNFNEEILEISINDITLELKGMYRDIAILFEENLFLESGRRLVLPSIIAENIKSSIINSTAKQIKIHKELANYYQSCLIIANTSDTKISDDTLGFSESIFHLTMSNDYRKAMDLLCDFAFIISRLRLDFLEIILEDIACLDLKEPENIRTTLSSWIEFLRKCSYLLRQGNTTWPSYKIFLQLAIEHGDDSPISTKADNWIDSSACNWTWFRRHPRPHISEKSSCLLINRNPENDIAGILELIDGRLISWTKSREGLLRFWDSRSGAFLKSIKVSSEKIEGVKQLDNERLLTWSSDNGIRLLNIQTGICLAVLKNDLSWVNDVLILPEEKIISWSSDGNRKLLWLWDSRNGKCITPFDGHEHGVLGVIMLRDGRLLSWSWDRNLILWNKDGKIIATLSGHTLIIKGALELKDGRLLSWSMDNTLRLWSGETGKFISVLQGHIDGVVHALELSSGNIISWSETESPIDKSIDYSPRVWDGQTGDCIAVLDGHTEAINGMLLLTDGRPLSWSEDGTLRIWDSKTGECLKILSGHVSSVYGARQLDDGRILSWSGHLRFWDTLTGKCLSVYEETEFAISDIIILSDKRLLSYGSYEDIRIWDSNNNLGNSDEVDKDRWTKGVLPLNDKQILSFDHNTLYMWSVNSGNCDMIFDKIKCDIYAAILLANERIITWGDQIPRLWNSHTGGCILSLKGHTDIVNGMLLLSNGNLLSWSSDKTLRIWNSQNGDCLSVFRGHEEEINGAKEIDDTHFLSWSSDFNIHIWDIKSESYLSIRKGHKEYICGAMVFDKERYITWSLDYTIKSWDINTSRCNATFKGHTRWIVGLLILDNERLLSWSADKTLRIWNINSGSCLQILEGHTEEVAGAIILSDTEILSWTKGDSLRAKDLFLRVWDSRNGRCIEEISEVDAIQKHPEWLWACINAMNPHCVNNGFFVISSLHSIRLCHRDRTEVIAAWFTDKFINECVVLSDGTVVITFKYQSPLYFLKLYHGSCRVSLTDLDADKSN